MDAKGVVSVQTCATCFYSITNSHCPVPDTTGAFAWRKCSVETNYHKWRSSGSIPEQPKVDAAIAAPASNTSSGGVKFDEGKPTYDLIPPEAIEGLAAVFAMGAKKYSSRNWEKGMRWGRVFAAMMRHAWAWWRGEEFDPKDGQHHLLSVMWCAAVLFTFRVRNVGEDDRSTGVDREQMEKWFFTKPFVTIDVTAKNTKVEEYGNA